MPHLEIHIGKTSSESTIKADGQDIAQFIQGVTVECQAGQPHKVTLKVVPFKTAPFDISGQFMEVPRCDKCQHWQAGSSDHPGLEIGTCGMVAPHAAGWSVPGLILTKPDFGCVLFRPNLTGVPNEPT